MCLSEVHSHINLYIKQLYKGYKVLTVTSYIIYVSWIITDIKDTFTTNTGNLCTVT